MLKQSIGSNGNYMAWIELSLDTSPSVGFPDAEIWHAINLNKILRIRIYVILIYCALLKQCLLPVNDNWLNMSNLKQKIKWECKNHPITLLCTQVVGRQNSFELDFCKLKCPVSWRIGLVFHTYTATLVSRHRFMDNRRTAHYQICEACK